MYGTSIWYNFSPSLLVHFIAYKNYTRTAKKSYRNNSQEQQHKCLRDRTAKCFGANTWKTVAFSNSHLLFIMFDSCYISRVCIHFPLIIVILLIRFRLFDSMLIRTCDNDNKKRTRCQKSISVDTFIHSFIYVYVCWLYLAVCICISS